MTHCILAMPLVVVLAALPLAAQRTPDTRISTTPAGGQNLLHPRVVATGDSVYVVWQNASLGAIHATRSLDRGATWLLADQRLDVGLTAGDSVAPDLCANGAAVYVAWEEHRASAANGDIWCNRSLDGGLTWQPVAVRLDVGSAVSAADSRTPRIACAGSRVVVVWEDGRNGLPDVYANVSQDGGATWLAADVRIDTGDTPGAHASVGPRVVCVGNSVHVVWADNRAGALDYDIFYNRSADGGVTWLPAAVRLDHGPLSRVALDPQIAATGSDLHVVWEDDRSGLKDIYSNHSTDGGVSWLPADVRIDSDPPGTGDSVDPQVCCTGSAVYVAWTDYRSFVFPQVFFRRSLDRGATWLAADVLLNHGTAGCFSTRPSLQCAGALVCVAWETQVCGGSGQPDIYCVRSTDQGATWLPLDVRLDQDGLGAHNSGEPQVALGGNHPHVVWTDYRTGTRPDIYWNVPFGMLPYGPATPGSGALAPRLVGNGAATLGSAVTLDVAAGLPGAAGVLLVGGPGSKVALPVLGGTVLVLPLLTLPLAVDAAGAVSVPLTVPAGAANVGGNVNFQVLLLDPGAAAGVSMTNAVELWIG